MATISVVIPAFNGTSRFLSEAVQSVLTQTFDDFEIIIIDDASDDDPLGCLPPTPKISYHRHPVNKGQAAARNSGAQFAKGEFLAFLDQDDLWEENFLNDTLQIFVDNPHIGLVHTDGHQVDKENHILEYDGAIKHTNSICQMLRQGHDTATSGSIMRKELFDDLGGFDERLTIWEDIDFGIRFSQCFPIYHLSKPLYRHRLYSHNASKNIPSKPALLARRVFLEKHQALCENSPKLMSALKVDWAQYYSDKGKYHLSVKEWEEAKISLLSALRLIPYSRNSCSGIFEPS